MLYGKCTIKILNKSVLEFDNYPRNLTKGTKSQCFISIF